MSDAKLNQKLFDKDVDQKPTRDGYGEGLVELGAKNPNVVVLTGDLKESTRAQMFEEKYPERFIEVGVAEQNMMGIAAGLAVSGKIPFISSYAVFSPGRSWDQCRVSVAYNRANVKIAGAHTGLSVGPDGATHQALEDMAIMRVLPNMIVVAPCDAIETKKCTVAVAGREGPAYFRFAREKTPIITTEQTPFTIGKAEIFWSPPAGGDNPQVAIIACGTLVHEALLAAQKLEKQKIGAIVVNSHTIKPLDAKTITEVAKRTGAVVTVEEHQITCGLGGAVAEALAEHYPVPIERIGMRDTFGESGEPQELLKKYQMTAPAIVKAAQTVMQRK